MTTIPLCNDHFSVSGHCPYVFSFSKHRWKPFGVTSVRNRNQLPPNPRKESIPTDAHCHAVGNKESVECIYSLLLKSRTWEQVTLDNQVTFLKVFSKMVPKGGMKISNSTDASSHEQEEINDFQSKIKQQDSKKRTDSMPYHKLFSFADTADLALMLVGTVAAISNGVSLPLTTVLFGDMINTFGKTSDIKYIVHEVSKVACWTITGERQASQIRNLYLKAILRQDIAFFDKEVNTGEVIAKISGDTFLIQDAMGEKFMMYTQTVSLGQASPCTSAFAAGQVAAFKMFETINRKPEIDAYDTTGTTLVDIRGDIELKDVCFSYPARPHEQILKGLSLFVQGGTSVALVGESGSGKSTIISLIERFYDPQAGEVLIDGINLKEFKLRWIRGKIGLLSGGQKQRVAIARAVLKDPRILLLDEATSALDAESESILQEALDHAMKNRTTVIVAHRLTTVRNANMITVVHQGSIAEKVDQDNIYATIGQQLIQTSSQLSTNRWSSVGSDSFHPLSESFRLPVGLLEAPMETSQCEGSLEKIQVPVGRLASLNKPEIPLLLLGAIAAIISGILLPIFGALLSSIIRTLYEPPTKLRRDSKFWTLMLTFLGLATLLSIPARAYLFAIAGSKLIERIRAMSFDKIVHMEVGWFDKLENSSGAIGARLSADAATVRTLVGDTLALAIQNAATLVAGLAIAFSACWQLALIILALAPLVVGITQYSSLAPDSAKAKSATASVFAILDRKSKIDSSDDSGTTLDLVEGNIVFDRVSFRYPTRPDVRIFHDLCFAVQSGKRFYDLDSGHILLDGVEIKKLKLRWLRQQMGLVSQEPVLFNDTVRANIAYGKGGDATESEIVAAADSANAYQFISGLQQGYDTLVGERGAQLSGGQKQRLAIARAIIKDPNILLFDEATSALDTESERAVQEALERVMINRTTIIVAHRLSTIKGADMIAVLKDGTIVEKGKHEDLINIKDGFYATLVAFQSG
ncbi:hypothetical protein B296_00040976 [Ensete ventricosum]|uniref:ABC transporter domain-containing protein n=1 Tax=Ensete ventricosum TaxID=4639 RepID=A0A426ZNR0_ENSVE|nr:hypothetical protein B296_00040976 [Ensete ventricosum]